MLVHQMAVLHYGMMRATTRMDEELDAAGVIDPNKPWSTYLMMQTKEPKWLKLHSKSHHWRERTPERP
jgi:hypothetical protein